MRRVLFVTAIRSEYDILYSVMRAVQQQREMELGVIVTGAHLSPLYGYTVRQVEGDGFPIIARVESLLSSDSPGGRVKSAAIQLTSLVDVITQFQPTFVIAPMDREEAITVALAGAYMRIPVVHIGGGEMAEDGNIDNAIRQAVTKIAHLHMVTTQRSAERVIAMGEEPWRVHLVGAPGLDRLLSTPDMPLAELWQKLGYDPGNQPFAIVIQHSIVSDIETSGAHMRLTLESLASLEIPAFISYPNSDAGSQKIIAAIETSRLAHPELFHSYPNLSRLEFVNLLRRAYVLIGNSSCGIVEAPLFHLPVVNVGPRQRGREHADNVQFVDHDAAQIRSAIQHAAFDNNYRQRVRRCTNPYGDGHAGERIAQVLAQQSVDNRLIYKVSTF